MDHNNNTPIDDATAFTAPFEVEPEKIIIKAVGVGGGGNNAVDHMFRQGIKNVSFANINTDSQTLRHSPVPVRVTLGDGCGAGNDPAKGCKAAEEAAEQITTLFDDDTKMVFITAGMGGGTGTGAAPVVARLAKECGLLTVGIVTIPFKFEGLVKIRKAIAGADEMAKYVDALLVINNERLTEIYGDLDFMNAFGKADDTLSIAARSISELITGKGLIDLDFNDVKTTLKDGGAAIISTGYGEGPGRVTMAIQDALNSPLLKNRDILGSKKLLFNIYFNRDAEEKFLMSETNELTDFISSINTDVDVIWGVGFDDTLGNSVKITILAAGFDVTLADDNPQPRVATAPVRPAVAPVAAAPAAAPAAPAPATPAAPVEPRSSAPAVPDSRIEDEYGRNIIDKDRKSVIVLGPNQMDDDNICDILEKNPTYKRPRNVVETIRNGAASTPAPGASSNQQFYFG